MIDITTTTSTPPPASPFELHPRRGPFNAAFFAVMGPILERSLRRHKLRVYSNLTREVVELGAGVGANFRYLPPNASVIAIEPNRYMHEGLSRAAHRNSVQLDIRERVAEDTGLADHSVDTVISSLVLCSVHDPAVVLTEVRRILRPGGTFRFVEHVGAEQGTLTRLAQRLFRRPWAWTFEGCSCERDLEGLIREAGFEKIGLERYRIHTPFLPFNTQIAGVARA